MCSHSCPEASLPSWVRQEPTSIRTSAFTKIRRFGSLAEGGDAVDHGELRRQVVGARGEGARGSAPRASRRPIAEAHAGKSVLSMDPSPRSPQSLKEWTPESRSAFDMEGPYHRTSRHPRMQRQLRPAEALSSSPNATHVGERRRNGSPASATYGELLWNVSPQTSDNANLTCGNGSTRLQT